MLEICAKSEEFNERLFSPPPSLTPVDLNMGTLFILNIKPLNNIILHLPDGEVPVVDKDRILFSISLR